MLGGLLGAAACGLPPQVGYLALSAALVGAAVGAEAPTDQPTQAPRTDINAPAALRGVVFGGISAPVMASLLGPLIGGIPSCLAALTAVGLGLYLVPRVGKR